MVFCDRDAVTGETCTQPQAPSPSAVHLGSLGLIEVVVLRCLNSADSMAPPPLHVSPSAPINKGRPRIPRSEPSPSSLGRLFFDGAGDPYLPKPTSFSFDGIEDQSIRSESKTVRFGEGEGWGYSYTRPSTGTGTWHAMDGSYDRSYRREVFHPDETWERRTQAYEHYYKDWQNPNSQYDETRGRDTLRDKRDCRQDSFNPRRARPLTIDDRRPRIRPEGNRRTQHPDPPVTSKVPPIYRPSRQSPPGLQRYSHQRWYPASEVEIKAHDDRYTAQDQYDRSGYVDNHGDWVGEEFGNPRFGWTGDSLLEPQPPSLPSMLQEEPTDLRHWKIPSEYNGRSNVDDARSTPHRGSDDIRKHNNHHSDVVNTWKDDAGPDVNNWIIYEGSGTWRPPATNDTNLHGVKREDLNALGLPAAKVDSGITHAGQRTWTIPNSTSQPAAGHGDQTNDANRSNQGGGKNVRSSRESSGDGGQRKTDRQNSNWGELGNSKTNNNAFKRGGSKPNGRGCNERNCIEGREISNKGSRNGSGNGANRNTSRGGSGLNERGYHNRNWNEGQENGDCHDQRNNWNRGGCGRANAGASVLGKVKSIECGHDSGNWGNDSRSNNGRVSRSGGGQRTNRSNTSQVNIDSGEGGNKGLSNRAEGVWDRGSRHGNCQDAKQGHPKNEGENGRSNGNDDLSNRGRGRGRSRGNGKSVNGGSACGGSGGNPVKPDYDLDGLRAGGKHTRSNRGENATSYEIGNTQSGEDGDWGGDDTVQGQGVPNGDNSNDRWNNNTGENWDGGNGNDGGCLSGPDGNGNTDNWSGGNGEPRDNGEWDGGNSPNPNPGTTNRDWVSMGHYNGNGDNADLGECNNGTNDSGGDAYKAGETNDCKEQTSNLTGNQQIDTEEVATPNSPSAEHNLPYAKPYWSSWTAESERAVSPTEPNTSRKRADSFHSGEELPLYSIHKDQLGNRSARHQVRYGRPEYYARNLRKPVYLDTMAEPYAVFAFKYRSKRIILLSFSLIMLVASF
jgi:hypothetical protein